ncbi:MAG: hypothetical protein EZS28_011007 [Streblomastix strix]|uniref:Uncharacterized protein n=1 Tax=Streblomastix strix TaxID=222440 RepID=A0A5J4WF22_9EUKA|nr:MAG: hypothetical protein EZS28_011007 [Streblomastix strix]
MRHPIVMEQTNMANGPDQIKLQKKERPGLNQHAGNYTDQIPPFMRAVLVMTPSSPATQRQQQQLDVNTQMHQQYYKKNVADLDLIGETATKHQRQLLLQREDEKLCLELNKFGAIPSTGEGNANIQVETSQSAFQIQRACVAGSAAMIYEDSFAVQRIFLTNHHAARILAGDTQKIRELVLVKNLFKVAFYKNGDSYRVLGKLSKDWVKEQMQINKQELLSSRNIQDSGKDLSRETIMESLNSITINNINTPRILSNNQQRMELQTIPKQKNTGFSVHQTSESKVQQIQIIERVNSFCNIDDVCNRNRLRSSISEYHTGIIGCKQMNQGIASPKQQQTRDGGSPNGAMNHKMFWLSRLCWRGDYSNNEKILHYATSFLQSKHQLNLFANRRNKRYLKFSSILQDRHVEGKQGAFTVDRTNQSHFLHPLIELILRVLKRLKKQPETALFLLPNWCRNKYQSIFPSVISQLDLEACLMTLIEGRTKHKHLFKLPPGNLITVLKSSMPIMSNH